MLVYDQICQRLELWLHVAGGEMLEMAKADKALGHARHDGGGFHGFARHGQGRACQRQGTRGGNSQGCHGFAAEKLADRGAQHGAAVAHARVGRAPRALELNFEALACLAQQDGPAIAKLAGPVTELVAAIDRGQGLAAVGHHIAGQHLQGLVAGQPGRVQVHP